MIVGGIDTATKVMVVAEIGNNHEGDVDVALELVDRAAEVGADAVKFQTFRTERFVAPADEERYARMRRFELSPEQFAALAERARARDLRFVSTALDLESAAVLEPLVDAYKIASGDNTLWPLIGRVLDAGKPVIISTGLLEAAGVDELVGFVQDRWGAERTASRLALLQCVTAYPAAPEESSLGVIRTLADRHGVTVGFSDHSVGIDVAPLAVAAGARIVEKHFTLDKEFSDFRDHRLSADPAEFRELVARIRRAEALYGGTEKRVQPSEREMVRAVRRSIVAATDLPAGHRIGAADLMWLRPGNGLTPGREAELIGRTLRRGVSLGEQLALEDVEPAG